MINRGDYIIQQTHLPEDTRWYVHEVALLDMGRFEHCHEAVQHKIFLEERDKA